MDLLKSTEKIVLSLLHIDWKLTLDQNSPMIRYLKTGVTSVKWSEDFHNIVSKVNELWQRNPPNILTGSPKVSKKTDLLSEGTRVRVKLDEPISVLGNKLHGKFRTGDIRWNPNIRVIKKMILSPEQPPTYLLNGPHGRLGVSRCAYT
ncbi:hypothetical protein PPL_12641 [Rhizophagus irregularis DAOM 181602=DAOM 197198]|nr:hypothetical protein PPL_12641 [Rhizophagus irregularis DAOM 181602=DAOM 197198]